jgi:DNA repair exonuclease SbcCD ATPase subunit
MRIQSAILRNCRLHRELKVEFDPARTVIGGPNESGKSTLIEAIHRAFFLRAKGNTEQHRALVSTLHPGQPEVEVTFAAEGRAYVLRKRFGANGTATLIPAHGATLTGEAAETELARLLKAETNLSGKAVLAQWGHLWIWQRQAGDDPSTHATAQCDGLLQQLQRLGGAAALQSELDARLAKAFADRKDAIYTQSGRPKVGSDLERAESALAAAQADLDQAQARVQKLEAAAAQLEAGTADLADAEASLQKLHVEQEAVDARARRLAELEPAQAREAAAARTAHDQCAALESAHQKIEATRLTLADVQGRLAPRTAELGVL